MENKNLKHVDMKRIKMIIKVIAGIMLFFIGMLWGLLTLERFTSPSELETIAGHYICWESGSPICSIHNTKKKMDIPPTVLEYKTDGKYITVKQHPDMPQNAFYNYVDYPNYNTTALYYWIINSQCDSIVEGPLDYQSFKDKCTLLHIEDSLYMF